MQTSFQRRLAEEKKKDSFPPFIPFSLSLFAAHATVADPDCGCTDLVVIIRASITHLMKRRSNKRDAPKCHRLDNPDCKQIIHSCY